MKYFLEVSFYYLHKKTRKSGEPNKEIAGELRTMLYVLLFKILENNYLLLILLNFFIETKLI